MIIYARAPLRLGLAGGGTDVSPYCEIYGGKVLNATIDRYVYASIKVLKEPVVRFFALDQCIECCSTLSMPQSLDGNLKLHKAVYNYIIHNFNNDRPIALELSTFCDSPAGSGLGSSSTLVVAMVHAFAELLELSLDDHSIARIAYHVERVDGGLQGGRQDQYSAAFGGVNFMEFWGRDQATITPLPIEKSILCQLESSLILYFTGISRHSERIIADQSNNVESGVIDATEAMHGIQREALTMKSCLLNGDFNGLVESIRLGWRYKKRSAKTVSNLSIDRVYNEAIQSGALAGKVSGAGGGGFMWFFVPLQSRMKVIETLETSGGKVSNCHFTSSGAQAWRAPVICKQGET